MKRNTLFFLLIGGLAFWSCRGDTGPPGPRGPQGPAGEAALTKDVFEVQVNFTAQNEYFEALVLDPPIGQNDIILVYLLWEVIEGDTDIWRPLPQTSPEFTEQQIFRIVALETAGMIGEPDDYEYETVMEFIGKTDADFRKIDLRVGK
ncbi:MAG: hypothetical protein LC670_09165 [Flavobacteriales bacterium]|nr:hypothetical protein [Flavobacteriales bacterium]